MTALPLLLHLSAFIVMVTGVGGSVVVHLLMLRAARSAPGRLPGLGAVAQVVGPLSGIGALCMLLTGLYFLFSRGWADVGQPWLTAKLTLFVGIWILGMTVTRPTGMRLGQAIAGGPANVAATDAVLSRLSVLVTIQALGLLAIVTLAVVGPR